MSNKHIQHYDERGNYTGKSEEYEPVDDMPVGGTVGLIIFIVLGLFAGTQSPEAGFGFGVIFIFSCLAVIFWKVANYL